MSRSFLPTGDNSLYNFALNFSNLLTANFAAYSLQQSVATTYSSKFNTYKTALGIAKADATRGKSTVYAKEQAKKDLISYTRLVAGQINRTMTVTNQQRTDLGLIVRKQPSPVPAPAASPTVTVTGVTMRTVEIRVFDAASASKRKKYPNALGAKIYTYIGSEYPADPALWAYNGDATKDKYSITFDGSVPNGAQVWVCAAWFNRNGTGPVSVPISTNIQGGGAQAQQQELKIAA